MSSRDRAGDEICDLIRAGRSDLDAGIAKAVLILRENGVETFESCEGGPGHCFPEPTIRFHGALGAGWHALSVCLDYGLPVHSLRRTWSVIRNEATGPKWELVFRELPR